MLTYCWRWRQFHNCKYWRLSFWQNEIVSHFCCICSQMGSDLQRQWSNLQLRIKIPGEVSGAFLSGTANFRHPIACNFTSHAFGNEFRCFQGSVSPHPLRCAPGLVSLSPAGPGFWALRCSAFSLCLNENHLPFGCCFLHCLFSVGPLSLSPLPWTGVLYLQHHRSLAFYPVFVGRGEKSWKQVTVSRKFLCLVRWEEILFVCLFVLMVLQWIDLDLQFKIDGGESIVALKEAKGPSVLGPDSLERLLWSIQSLYHLSSVSWLTDYTQLNLWNGVGKASNLREIRTNETIILSLLQTLRLCWTQTYWFWKWNMDNRQQENSFLNASVLLEVDLQHLCLK